MERRRLKGLVAGFSRDGGRTFQRSVWPVSRCAPGGLNYERASDPWVSIGPEGTVYGSALSFDVNSPRNTVAALTSYDGGRTWRNVTVLIDDTQPQFADDKNSVTADPVRPGSAYQVWDRLEFSPDLTEFVDGPTYLSVTRDFGRTWSTPRVIVTMAPFQQTIGNVIVVDHRTGALYNFYESIQYTDATGTAIEFARFEVVRSTDAGATWSAPTIVANDSSVLPVNPNTGQPLRTGFGLPFPAIDPRTGELYMAYEGSDFTGGQYNQIQLVHSTDRGRTWSAPVRVNGDPSVLAFTPSIAVTNDGDVGVTYYDLRKLRPGNTTTLPTSTWLTVSPRGGGTSTPNGRSRRCSTTTSRPTPVACSSATTRDWRRSATGSARCSSPPTPTSRTTAPTSTSDSSGPSRSTSGSRPSQRQGRASPRLHRRPRPHCCSADIVVDRRPPVILDVCYRLRGRLVAAVQDRHGGAGG